MKPATRERSAIAGIGILVVLLCWFGQGFLRGEAIWIFGSSAVILWMAISFLFSPGRRASGYLVDPEYRPFITLVIPAYNEERVVAGSVEAALHQNYHDRDGRPLFEVVAVNDRSTDGTAVVLKGLQERVPELQVYDRQEGSKGGKGEALMAVLPLCRGEVIGYLDADALIVADFLDNVVPYLADPRVGAVQAQKRIKQPAMTLLERLQADEAAMMAALQRFREMGHGAVDLMGNGMVIKRIALEEVGGWDATALTEDLDLGTRLHVHNWQVRFAEEAVVWEEAVPTWRGLYRQRLRWAEGSYRRFCRYFWALMWFNVPGSKTVDMLAYMAGFILPLWLAADSLVQLLDLGQNPFDFNLLSFIGLWILLVTPIQVGRTLYADGVRHPRALVGRSLATSFYLLIWIPTALVSIARILWTGRPSAWVKTDHFGRMKAEG